MCVPNFVKIGQSVAKILNFSIFEDGGRPPYWIRLGISGPPADHSAKFGYDRCSSFYMNISIFDASGWKMPNHAPKIGGLGQFDPLNGVQYHPEPKRHTLA